MGDLYGEKKVDIRETTNYLIILRNYITKIEKEDKYTPKDTMIDFMLVDVFLSNKGNITWSRLESYLLFEGSRGKKKTLNEMRKKQTKTKTNRRYIYG